MMEKAVEAFWRDVPRVPVMGDPRRTHATILAPYVDGAARLLAGQRFGRCICDDVDCQANQISVKAWHLYWAHKRNKKAARKQRQARKKRRGWA